MPKARLKPCAQPGCPELQQESRCTEHRRDDNRYRRATTPTKIHEPRDRARRAAAVNAHRDEYGDWCPGYERPAHPAADLTADHVEEIAMGGDPYGELQIFCRSCNSRKARRHSRADPHAPTYRNHQT